MLFSPAAVTVSMAAANGLGADVEGVRTAGVNSESVSFNSNGTLVSGTLYYPTDGGIHPAVVFGVGYTAELTSLFNSTNYGWLGEGLASRGYVVLVVKYATNLTNPMDVLNVLGNYTVWVEQTRDAVSALIHNGLSGASVSTSDIVDPKRIALGGHSIGGAGAIVSGAQDRRVKCVFAMSPQTLGARPNMNTYAGLMSPVPLQLQVGELDELGGVGTTQQTYNSASTPKEIVKYRYGTYEGFTDLGKAENIQMEDVPAAIRDILQPYLQTNPLSTKQVDMALNFTSGFLDYYLKNHESFNIHSDYSEDFLIPPVPPVPPTPVPDVWHANVTASGLDEIFQSVSIDPDMLDFAQGSALHISVRVTPRGIFESGVKANITYPEGASEEYDLTFNDSYSTAAGDFYVNLDIPISHDLGTGQIVVKATDDRSHTYTSQPQEFTLTTTSDKPVINSVDISPSPMVPGEDITFTISASDKDGIAYYSFDFGDGTKTGWVQEKTTTHTYQDSGIYTLKIRVKDSKAQESSEWSKQVPVSHPPVAKLSFDSPVFKGKSIVFDASKSSDPDGDDIEYFFSFGDTGEDTGWISNSKVMHTFSNTGKFAVSLKVRDSNGVESQWSNKTVNVEEESSFHKLTSSSGFPVLIVIVIGAIIGGGYFLLRGGEEEKPEEAETGRKPAPDGKGGKPTGGGPRVAGQTPKARGEGRRISARPAAPPLAGKLKGKEHGRPMGADGKPAEGKKKGEEIPMARPMKRRAPGQEKKERVPESAEGAGAPETEKKAPESEKPVAPEEEKKPKVDAPPVEEPPEEEDRDIWDEDDFAIPVALKDKLKRE